MAASALTALWSDGWQNPAGYLANGLLFGAGGAVAFPLAFFAAQFLSDGKPIEARFAAAFLCLALATVAVTSILYGLHFRLTFDEEHAALFTPFWFFEFAFGMASAFYRFGLFGARLYFPLGLVFLSAASLVFARSKR